MPLKRTNRERPKNRTIGGAGRTVPKPWEDPAKPVALQNNLSDAPQPSAGRRHVITIPAAQRRKPGLGWIPVPHESIAAPGVPTKAMTRLAPSEIENRHRGETVFVLGNGPSVLEAEKLPIWHRPCISIYVSYWLGHCKYIIFPDMMKNDAEVYEELLAQDSHIFVCKYPGLPRWFNKYGQYENNSGQLSDKWPVLYNGGNSSFHAINLAYIMGARRIAVLGIDMTDGRHFYDELKEFHDRPFYRFAAPKNAKRNPGNRSYKGSSKAIRNLKKVEKFLENREVELINCSPYSKHLFGKYRPLEKVLKEK